MSSAWIVRALTGALFACSVAACGSAHDAHPQTPADPDERPQIELTTLEGDSVDPWSADSTRVFLFTRTDCPISNRYAPEILRLSAAFAGNGVQFFLVYLDADQTAQAIREHREAFALDLPVLRDDSHALVQYTGSSVTPSAAVFDAGGRLVYEGRIDDRFVAFGKARSEPSVRDLQSVLEKLVRGEQVAFERTRAVGCFIADLRPEN